MQRFLSLALGTLLLTGQVQSGMLLHQCRSHGVVATTCACAKHAARRLTATRVQTSDCCQVHENAPVTAATSSSATPAPTLAVSPLLPASPLGSAAAIVHVAAATERARSSPPLFQSNCVYRL